MAITHTEFTVRSGGSNLYAGTLDGVNEASTTPLVSYTNGNWNSATGVFTPASGNPVTDGVTTDHWVSIYNDGAGAPTGFIAAVMAVSSTTITVSLTRKSGTAPTTSATARTMVVGGAWSGPTGSTAFPFGFAQNTMTDASGNFYRINFKNDQTPTMTAAITHSLAGEGVFQGYTTTFGDGGRVTLQGATTGASYIALTLSGGSNILRDFIIKNNGLTGTANGLVVSTTAKTILERVVVNTVRGNGIFSSATAYVSQCEVYAWGSGNNAAGIRFSGGGSLADRCFAHDDAGTGNSGFDIGATGISILQCVTDTVSGSGLTMGAFFAYVDGCNFYNCTAAGIITTNAASVVLAKNCILSNNGTFGINNSVTGGYIRALDCAFFSNTSGQMNGVVDDVGSVTLSGNPFTDAANGDFTLNNTSGAGAACRGTGMGNFTQTATSYAGTIGYPDIGAAQHQDSGGGGSVSFSTTGRMIG